MLTPEIIKATFDLAIEQIPKWSFIQLPRYSLKCTHITLNCCSCKFNFWCLCIYKRTILGYVSLLLYFQLLDINECNTANDCHQECINTVGSLSTNSQSNISWLCHSNAMDGDLPAKFVVHIKTHTAGRGGLGMGDEIYVRMGWDV